MATILQLATLIGERCGCAPGPFIRHGRELGYFPHSGPGGRGSRLAPAATVSDTVILLLAMLQRDKEPKEAIGAVEGWAAFEPFIAIDFEVIALANGDIDRRYLGAFITDDLRVNALGMSIRGILESLRFEAAAPHTAFVAPRELVIGGIGGVANAALTIHLRMPDSSVVERTIAYGPPGVDMASIGASADSGLRMAHAIGGNILREIADLLGPVIMDETSETAQSDVLSEGKRNG